VLNLLARVASPMPSQHPAQGLANNGGLFRSSAGASLLVRRRPNQLFRLSLRTITNGLGFMLCGYAVHRSRESDRPRAHVDVTSGLSPVTHCRDYGVGLVYHDTSLTDAVGRATERARLRRVRGRRHYR